MIQFIFDEALADEEPVVPATQVKRVRTVAHAATSGVSVGATGRTFLTKSPEKWTWKDLRDYVLFKIEERDGTAGPRSETRELGIFKRFALEFGEQAGPIAVFAFQTCDGYWRGSPVGVGRFAKASDDFFAREILLKHLSQKR